MQPTWCLHLYCWQDWRAANKGHKARQVLPDLRDRRARQVPLDLRETNSGFLFFCSVAEFSFYLLNSSGSFATLAAIRRASSFVSNLAADRRPGSSSK